MRRCLDYETRSVMREREVHAYTIFVGGMRPTTILLLEMSCEDGYV